VVAPKENQRKRTSKGTWGGRRPGAGAPKASLNEAIAHRNNQGQNNREPLARPNTEHPDERNFFRKPSSHSPTTINRRRSADVL
jgi:hypothetical protein